MSTIPIKEHNEAVPFSLRELTMLEHLTYQELLNIYEQLTQSRDLAEQGFAFVQIARIKELKEQQFGKQMIRNLPTLVDASVSSDC